MLTLKQNLIVPEALCAILALGIVAAGCSTPANSHPSLRAGPEGSQKANAPAEPEKTVVVNKEVFAWTSLPASNPKRMVRETKMWEYYSTVWDARPDPVLVVLGRGGISLGSDHYTVWVVDSGGKILRQGTITCSKDDRPYCLVEIRTQSQSLLEKYRGKWVLAIGLFSFGNALGDLPDHPPGFVPGAPSRFYAGRVPDEPGVNLVDVEPIVWDDDHQELLSNASLMDDQVEFRAAEKAFAGVVKAVPK
ncbi:MAG TPA: hypothetical protein VFE47_02640 [Tepidisphaeraceae bacterium]|jgi:hypothetical protein|nr:hypothetical protein [Tepidisphaeraceae bacterium]